MNFSELNLSKQLLNALTDLGFSEATPIQQNSFNQIMSGRDVVGIAQTGTGKTFAYLLPILRQLTFSYQRNPRVIILVPTRELVVQVIESINKLSKYQTVRVAGIYGGANINTQRNLILDGLDILVATPGRMIDMLIDRVVVVNQLQKLVIDEVDEMLSLGFRTQLNRILEMMPVKRQTLLFSATLDEEIENLINNYFTEPIYIETTQRGKTVAKITQSAYAVPNFYTKVNLLEYLLTDKKTLKKVLVFCKNKTEADAVYKELAPVFEEEISIIHSNKSQPQRFEAIARFSKKDLRILIATDVIARGIDFENVSHVINFNLPLQTEDYVHRVGRTGRSGKSGEAISLVTEKEKILFEKIEQFTKQKIKLLQIPEEVEITDVLTKEERPVYKDKSLKKLPKFVPKTGAFHEKKAKNKKKHLGGKRKQETLKRKYEAQIKLRSKK